ncbi:hypothetical protein WJX81_005577 [Elliptochloris bilobata]|uniref:Exocyst subunit Exo70 family protein n=1 Tax=Elliptochloris bilobata TaxID=381761 RepID=A0AAW1QI82_9CHLO
MDVQLLGAGARAVSLREGLQWSERLSKETSSVLDAYTARLADLQLAVAPVTQRTQALQAARTNIRKARERAEEVLGHVDTARQVEAKILAGPQHDFGGFLRALQRLEAAIAFLSQHRSLATAEAALGSATALRGDALRLALEDFTATLRAHASGAASAVAAPGSESAASSPSRGRDTPLAGSDAGIEGEGEALPGAAAARLRSLAEAMLRNSEPACFKVYCEVRRGVAERAVADLVTAAPAGEDPARVPWPALEARIQAWILALRRLVRAAVAEHRAAAAVWPAPHDEAAFSEVIARPLAAAAQAGALIVAARRAPEKVFGLLDMQEHLEAAAGPLSRVLAGTACARMLGDMVALAAALRAEARATLGEFEATIARDAPRGPPPDGTVHPLAAYTLSFLKRMFGYEAAVETLFGAPADEAAALAALRAGGAAARRTGGAGGEAGEREAVRAAVCHILEVLLANLTAKARVYKDRALAALFLMNNVHYMVRAVEGSEALRIVGAPWLEAHRDLVEQAGEQYQALAWGPLQALLAEPPGGRAMDKAGVKARWRDVNAALGVLHESQSAWTIPDAALRANMKDALLDDVLPLYEVFVEQYSAAPGSKEKYVKYTPAELRAAVQSDLFEMRDDARALHAAASLKRRTSAA